MLGQAGEPVSQQGRALTGQATGRFRGEVAGTGLWEDSSLQGKQMWLEDITQTKHEISPTEEKGG